MCAKSQVCLFLVVHAFVLLRKSLTFSLVVLDCYSIMLSHCYHVSPPSETFYLVVITENESGRYGVHEHLLTLILTTIFILDDCAWGSYPISPKVRIHSYSSSCLGYSSSYNLV